VRINLTILSVFIRLTSGAVALTSRRPPWTRTIPTMTSSATTRGTRTGPLTRSFPPASLSSSPSVRSHLLVAYGNPPVFPSNIRASPHFAILSVLLKTILAPSSCGTGLRVHTEWQRPLSGIHYIMMEKLAQAGEGGKCTPIPFHYIYHHVTKLQCTLRLRGQIH
jgi:hypothetical protein